MALYVDGSPPPQERGRERGLKHHHHDGFVCWVPPMLAPLFLFLKKAKSLFSIFENISGPKFVTEDYKRLSKKIFDQHIFDGNMSTNNILTKISLTKECFDRTYFCQQYFDHKM